MSKAPSPRCRGAKSGHPGDPHYNDRLDSYLAGELQSAPWSEEEIVAATISELSLLP